jgi:hypothetical protein
MGDTGVFQGIQGTPSNILALMAEMLLLAGCGVAYTQIIWRTMRHKLISINAVHEPLRNSSREQKRDIFLS